VPGGVPSGHAVRSDRRPDEPSLGAVDRGRVGVRGIFLGVRVVAGLEGNVVRNCEESGWRRMVREVAWVGSWLGEKLKYSGKNASGVPQREFKRVFIMIGGTMADPNEPRDPRLLVMLQVMAGVVAYMIDCLKPVK